LPLLVSGILVLLALALLGQDDNWDLRNYHLYTPYALMSGRFSHDIAAGQLQTWHNPALDFPFAWMVRHGLPGWLVSLWLALPTFVAMTFALRLLDLAWPAGQGAARTIAAGFVAATGASVLPGIGTTFNDAFVAAGVLPALWWLVDSQGKRGEWATWLPAGLLAGLAAGFKLTGAPYCVGLVGAALAAGSWRAIPSRLLALGIGGAAGVLLGEGPWALYLWREHGNPLFPYFNQWFRSPDAAPVAYSDQRFVPHGADAWLVPFRLLARSAHFSEIRLADPRMLLGLAALFAAWPGARRQGGNVARMLLVFAIASFAVWVRLYGVYRYLAALELLCSVAVIGTLSLWLTARFLRIGLVVAVLLLAGATHRPNWGRLRFGTPMVDVRYPALPAGSMVLLGNDQPLGYAVAYLPPDIAAISVRNNFMAPDDCTRLQARAEARVRAHAGPFFLLREPAGTDAPAAERPWRAYGLEQRGTCRPVASNLGKLELCPLVREFTPPVACAVPAPDR
jgi:hypothetical protein